MAGAAVMTLGVPAGGEAAVLACNESELRQRVTTCPAGQHCVVEEEIECNTSCPAAGCVYDLGTQYGLTVRSNAGGTSHGKFTAVSRSMTFRGKFVKTDNRSAQVRFQNGTGITIDTLAAAHAEPNDIDLYGRIAGSDGMTVTIDGYTIRTGYIQAPGGSVTVNGREQVQVGNTIDVSISAWYGGFIWVNGHNAVTIGGGDGLLARRSGSYGTTPEGAGQILVTTSNPTTRPTIAINRKLAANSFEGSAQGGTVVVKRSPYYIGDEPLPPDITITAPVLADAAGTGNNGGTIEIDGWTIEMDTDELNANGAGAGSTGGTITVTARAPEQGTTAVLHLNSVKSKGGTGGLFSAKADGDIQIDGLVDVSALAATAGRGGTAQILPLSTPACEQDLRLQGNVMARGYGASGQGGTIEFRASEIYMASGVLREFNANSRQEANPSTGVGGTIVLQAREVPAGVLGGIVAVKGNNCGTSQDYHTISAQPLANGTIQTSRSRCGGYWNPTGSSDLPDLPCN